MLNITTMMGRLVADPELRHTASDVAVTSFSIAVDRSYVKAGKEREVDFFDVQAWKGTAEFICKYFTKGQLIAITGSLRTRTYTDKSNVKRKAVEIIVDNAYFADSKKRQRTR